MVHHWRPSDELQQTLIAGEWIMHDHGRRVGIVQLGRINGRWGFRGLTPESDVEERRTLGYSWSLEDAADRLWEWYRSSTSRG